MVLNISDSEHLIRTKLLDTFYARYAHIHASEVHNYLSRYAIYTSSIFNFIGNLIEKFILRFLYVRSPSGWFRFLWSISWKVFDWPRLCYWSQVLPPHHCWIDGDISGTHLLFYFKGFNYHIGSLFTYYDLSMFKAK